VRSIYLAGMENFGQSSPWYEVYVDYAIEKEIVYAKDFSDFTRAATRAEMAYIFSRALPANEYQKQNTPYSIPDCPDGFESSTGQPKTPHYNAIVRLYEAGIVTGSDSEGTFHPLNNITRAEAAAIISRVILPATRVSGKVY
jgi:hypothetical protein